MLEARLAQGAVLKKILEAIKDIISDANIDVDETGLRLQAMDPSHVALVLLVLKSDGFEPFTCTRPSSLGVNFGNLSKVVRCAGADDVITLKSDDDSDELTLLFESPHDDRISEYKLRLMSIDADHLGIEDEEEDAVIRMSSAEFARICKDMTVLAESVNIEVSKEDIKFSGSGELGQGVVILKPSMQVDDDSESLEIHLSKPVRGNFALKYLNMFTKAATLSDAVTLTLVDGKPLRVEYKIEELGNIRYYLAPKEDGEEEE